MTNLGDGIHASGHDSADPADTPETNTIMSVAVEEKPTIQ